MNRQISLLCLVLVFIICCTDSSFPERNSLENETDTSEIIANFEIRLKEDVEQDNLGSISTCIFKDNEIVWAKALGKSNTENGNQADTSTIYRTASISKTITAYLMMLLVQDGIIELDDPVQKYLPEISNLQNIEILDDKQITFRHLASHTSGLSREPDLENAATGLIKDWEDKLLSSITRTKLNNFPGEKYVYSNIGYGILGLALSRAAEKPFITLVDEMVFKPLNMNSSFFIVPKESEIKLAAGYKWNPFTGEVDDQKALVEHAGRGYKVPNGGIYSSPSDIARYLMAQYANNGLLSKELLEMMQTIQTPESKEFGYGLGYYIRNNDNGLKMIEHDGGVTGYNAYMVFSPDSRIGVIMMRNYNFGRTNILLESRSLLYQLSQVKKEN